MIRAIKMLKSSSDYGDGFEFDVSGIIADEAPIVKIQDVEDSQGNQAPQQDVSENAENVLIVEDYDGCDEVDTGYKNSSSNKQSSSNSLSSVNEIKSDDDD